MYVWDEHSASATERLLPHLGTMPNIWTATLAHLGERYVTIGET